MLCGISQRTGVAITLMGVLLLSVGTCVVPAHATHECCMHMGMACNGVKADCCEASPKIPPATVTPLFAGLASTDMAEVFLSTNNRLTLRGVAIAPALPAQSPPPGIFSLRI
jgi:hypothetical protein